MKQNRQSNSRFASFTWFASALLLCVGVIGSASAQEIISFTVESGVAGTTRNWMWPADLAGAPGVRTNNWNNIGNWVNSGTGNADAALLPGNVTNSAGALLPNVGAVFHNSSGGAYGDRAVGTTNDLKMFMDIADGFNETSLAGYGYLTVTNIPYTNYNVYVYFLPDNGNGAANTRGGVFCITNAPTGTNCVYMKNQSNDVANTQLPVPNTSTFASAYIQSTTTSIGAGGAAWSSIQGGNYGVFYGLTNANCKILFAGLGNGSGAVDPFGNYVTGGSTAVRFKVAGFQIYQVPSAAPTNIYLQNASLVLHAGNPSGTQVSVLANLSDGTIGVSETANCTFSSDNTNVFTVTATGLLKPGTNGAANLIVNLASAGLSLTNPVTVLGPTSLGISVGSTSLLVGTNRGDTTATALTANFSDASNVPVNNYSFVSFSTIPSGIFTAASNGTLTAVGVGSAQVVGSYDGLSITSAVISVSAYSAPGTVAAFSVNLTDANNPMTFHDLSGAPGARVAYWNNIVMSFGMVTNAIANPLDYHGTILTNTVVQVLPNNPPQQAIVFGTGTRTTNESVLFNVFFDQGANNGTSQHSYIVVSNVPYASYDAYFYFQNDTASGNVVTNRAGQVTINGVTQYRLNSLSAPSTPGNDGSGYVQAVQPGSPPTSCAQVPFGNYIKFSGLTDSTLNVDWGAVGQDLFLDAASVTRVRLAGFQLVKSLSGLTATNIYLQSAVPGQLPGNPAPYGLTLLADFTDGELGGNITSLPGVNYASSDPNVFTVDSNGAITSGQVPGVATLTVTYQTNTLTANVTNLAPTSVTVSAAPGVEYNDGSLGLSTAQAKAHANFPGTNNVNITGFSSIAFVDQGSPVCSVDAAGVISPTGTAGSASIGLNYLGTNTITANAFTVRSISDAPVLSHLYTFTNAVNSTAVIDTIGGANGTVFGPLGTNKPISFDGSHVIFPGDGAYTNEPYVSLQPGLISRMGDVTIEMWGGVRQRNTWARFFGFGSTPKGLTPYSFGGTANNNSIQFVASHIGTGQFEFYGSSTFMGTSYSLTNGAEYHIVCVLAPNAGTQSIYINGVLITNTTPVSQALSVVNDTVDWLGISLSNDDPPLAGWMNRLAIYEGAMSGAQIAANYSAGQSVYFPPVTVSTVPTNIVFAVSGNSLNLSWPADHLGWKLQAQTNSLTSGLGTNWVTIPGSDTMTSTNITINPANESVFYRLIY